MKKKQLLLQNTSLFAEIERKSGEIDSLKLRIEELVDKLEKLTAENAALERNVSNRDDELEKIKNENAELIIKLEDLSKKLQSMYELSEQNGKNNDAKAVNIPVIEMDDPLFGESEEKTVIPQPSACPPQIKRPAETKGSHYTPINDILRDYGAQMIGKVTRITAQTVAKAQQNGGDAAESLQTLALGKNESFKFQVLSLLESGRDGEDIRNEIGRLADEAIAYLESI